MQKKNEGTRQKYVKKEINVDPCQCCTTWRVLLHGARTVRHLMFLGILPGEEAHLKPLWRVFPNACGWSPEACG
jgi:hypothetical protein